MAKRNKIGYIKVRDPLMVALINGVTKSAVHRDRRKEADRKACRGKVKDD
jgi:hypothetical protein